MLPNLAVTTLVMDPNDPDTLYAGTGEGFFNIDAVRGDGVFVTTDAGETWNAVSFTAGNTDFNFVNKLAFSPNDSNTLYAATREGIYRTQDAGDSWALVHDGSDVFVGCTDLSVRNDLDVDTIIGSCGSFAPSRIVRSTDGGDTFEVVLQQPEMGRSTISIAPSDQNIIYVLNATNQNTTNNVGSLGLNAIFRSDDGGATWATQYSVNEDTALAGTFVVPVNPEDLGFTILNNPLFNILPACGIGFQQQLSQGWYDNIIQVDPVNPDVVWAAGIDIFRSSDAGQSWGITSNWFLETDDPLYAHADNHILTFPPGYDGVDNQSIYAGNDGGIQRVENATSGRTLTTLEACAVALENAFNVVPEDFGVDTFTGPDETNLTWENLNNGLQITQYYNGTAFPDGETYFGGTQDNGTLIGTDTAGTDNWIEIQGGDGGYVAVDPTNTDILFAETTNLSITRSNDGGQSFVGVTNGITGGGFPFITTFIMDSNIPQRLYILGNAIWRTDDQADNWVQASTDLTNGGAGSAVANAPSNSDRVLVGSNNGFIYRNADAGNADATTVWEFSEDLGGFISSVAFDPQDENIAYATSSTFGQNHIFRSIDAGATWTPIDNLGLPNGIPDIPVHSIAIDPEDSRRLFVGTDLGVFVSIDTGENWMVENGGFANTPTETLLFEGRNLFAFTHGRSAYRVRLNDLLRTSSSTTTTAEDTALEVPASMFVDNIDGANVFAAEFIEIVSVSNGTLTNNGESFSAGSIIAIDALNGLTFTPNQDFNGNADVSWQARDDVQIVSREPATISVDVTPVNDAPVATRIPDFTNANDSSISLNVSGSFTDVDIDSLTFTATGLPEGLTISSTGGVIVGDPPGGTTSSVTVTASDGEASASSTFTLTIPASGGSLNIKLLLALLILIGLRRRN
jgi:hypothetical protein